VTTNYLEPPISSSWLRISGEIVLVTSFFCLCFLLDENMGLVNEANVLPFARQHANPNWIPQDWYYNLPAGYRTLFIAIFGNMASAWGFLITSIVGRLICFALVASGLIFLARTLRLKIISLLVALTLLFYTSPEQGLIASEWIVRALEPKAIAYGFLLFGITFMLRGNDSLMALFLGLTISFHVLVGGWALVAVSLWFLFRRTAILLQPKQVISILAIYLVAASFAIPPIIRELTATSSDKALSASYIYVYLRTPHHLNPEFWSLDLWLKPLIYLMIFTITTIALWKQKETQHTDLAFFGLMTMVPFLLGVIIAPWDTQGMLLQYYPFRLGDIIFPLITGLLFLSLLQGILSSSNWTKQGFMFVGITIISLTGIIQGKDFYQSAIALPKFPHQDQLVTPELKEMCYWIRDNTPENETVISHPLEDISFTWVSERATIVKYKFVPPVSAAVHEWYQRLNDLSGTVDIRKATGRGELKALLKQGYNTLTTSQVRSLMKEYQANYLVTKNNHKLDLEIAHQNSRYILYYNSSATNT